MKKYDVVVIGAGPGGYVAAIRCAQLGLKTACVESWINDDGKPALGGTCLNVGCIPSKALLDSSHHYQHIKHKTTEHGINISGATIDINKMIARKAKIVKILTQGISGLFRKNKIDWLKGHASLLGNNQIKIISRHEGHDEEQTVKADNIIIATGSVPTRIPSAIVDDKLIVDSTGALKFNEIPRRLGVIGAGVIGLELGSVWNRLGSEVILLEALPTFLSTVDHQIAAEAEKSLRNQGLDIRLGAHVTGTGSNNREVTVNYESEDGKHQLTFDKLIVAVGRRPNTECLGAEACGLELDERGFIVVDSHYRTNLENVYAVGDVVGGAMLAHKASEEGVAIAERIADKAGHMNYDAIPWVIYTWPEIAWAGKSEKELQRDGIEYRVGQFPFMAAGRARTMGESEGLVKILGDSKTDRILGVHIFGANASEMIAEAVVAMEFDGSTEDLARTIHAHPTLSEAVHEAALGVESRTIHI